MKKIVAVFRVVVASLCLVVVIARENDSSRKINLPTSKTLTLPAPGFIARTNSYPATIALSPDGRYAALLNQGYGTEESGVRQSIAILDLKSNQLRDFPDDRLRGDEKSTLQSYFIGLAFSTDGKHLYASMASIKENGIAIYSFAEGKVSPERFIRIPPQRLAPGKKLTYQAATVPAGSGSPYPAGFSVLGSSTGDPLVVTNNLADNVILLDVASGRILQSFDVSISKYIPGAYPYAVIANKAGTKAWVCLWHGSAVSELDINKSRDTRHIELWRPSDPVAPGTHPTAMLLSRSEDVLYVALANVATANADAVAAADFTTGVPPRGYHTALDNADAPGAASVAIAVSPDEKYLYAASSALNAVAVVVINTNNPTSDSASTESSIGFIPAQWYPSALAVSGSALVIASAKGAGS